MITRELSSPFGAAAYVNTRRRGWSIWRYSQPFSPFGCSASPPRVELVGDAGNNGIAARVNLGRRLPVQRRTGRRAVRRAARRFLRLLRAKGQLRLSRAG